MIELSATTFRSSLHELSLHEERHKIKGRFPGREGKVRKLYSELAEHLALTPRAPSHLIFP